MSTGTTARGWANSTGYDKTLEAILGYNNITPFANATTLAPKPELSNATYGIPQAWGVASMPVADFYGNARTWPGSPGEVK